MKGQISRYSSSSARRGLTASAKSFQAAISLLSASVRLREGGLQRGVKAAIILGFCMYSAVGGLTASEVKFHDIAADDEGLAYQRTESESYADFEAYIQLPVVTFPDLFNFPFKSRGAPGVAVLDYDRDGDLDLFVTNGPGSDNSLFSNQLVETGELTFVDVGAAAGVGARDHDGSGVCFGDTDNDGDPDLFVLSNFGLNRFFENNGDGTFTDISVTSGLSEDTRSSLSCSFGDIDGDGLLDVVVGNSYEDMSNAFGIAIPFDFNQHNQLYLNIGGNTFADVSTTSGIQETRGFPAEFEGLPTLTWAIAMVDYDLDGDIDIVQADDQASVPRAQFPDGVNRGFIHIFQNDGSGNFTDVTVESNMDRVGEWMGLAFGDLNGDGYLDIFGSNFGDFNNIFTSPIDPVYVNGLPYELGDSSSRWFLGGSDGVFTDPGVGDLVATPFGWGTSATDYDNDADLDIVFHGGMAGALFVLADNTGVILENDGDAQFSFEFDALSESANHQRRNVQGSAVGDLNNDGFTDLVSVSNFDIQEDLPLIPYPSVWGSELDGVAGCQPILVPTDEPFTWLPSGLEKNIDGSLSVEISSADNGNGWVKVNLMGTVGLTAGGRVNRDGIGAVVTFRADGGDGDGDNEDKSMMLPVLGGASYASQGSLEQVFGLGSARRGQLDVLWPGGTRNRLYHVRSGRRVMMPEIPCSFDAEWQRGEYRTCVRAALGELFEAGVIDRRQRYRLYGSAIRAYFEERGYY